MLVLAHRHVIGAYCTSIFIVPFSIAALLANVTLASEDYRLVLIVEFCFALASLIPLVVTLILGPWQWRVVALVLALLLAVVLGETVPRLTRVVRYTVENRKP